MANGTMQFDQGLKANCKVNLLTSTKLIRLPATPLYPKAEANIWRIYRNPVSQSRDGVFVLEGGIHKRKK